MPAGLWSDPGTWIALGVSAVFLLAAWVMHRVFLKVLKGPDQPPAQGTDPTPSPPTPPKEPHP